MTNRVARQEIAIVVPVLNGAAFIEEALVSIIVQIGDFAIRLHVQDGGSTDGTLEIVLRLQEYVQRGVYGRGCGALDFTCQSEKDTGIYDAINKGFSYLAISDDAWMGWVGSDDRIAQGSFACIARLARETEHFSLLTSRVAVIAEDGSIIAIEQPRDIVRSLLEAGLYDGRVLPLLMQEGTFWRPWLWRKVDGLDASLKLAGDWDLWRRFAKHAEILSVDTVLGFHRKRKGQASEDMPAYLAEIDATLAKPIGGGDHSLVSSRTLYDKARQSVQLDDLAARFEKSVAFDSNIAINSFNPDKWIVDHRRVRFCPPYLDAINGLDRHDDPVAELNLDNGYYWMVKTAATFTLLQLSEEFAQVIFRLRNPSPEQQVTIIIDGVTTFKSIIPCDPLLLDTTTVKCDLDVSQASHHVCIRATQYISPRTDERDLYVLVESVVLHAGGREAAL